MLVIRGVNVYPSEVERVVLADPAISPDYLLVLDERADARRLVACLEYRAGQGSGPSEADLEARLRAELGIGVQVRLLPAGTVPRSEAGKAVRVIRWQAADPPLPGLT
jgi:phenylacetate-CoA ligase